MGIDPTSPHYEAGVPCAQCGNVIFGGNTPVYILALLSAIETCPGAPVNLPNEPIYLEQSAITPCKWAAFVDPILYELRYEGGTSLMRIGIEPVLFYFYDEVAEPCAKHFINELIVCGGFTIGRFGRVDLFWGPGIEP